MGDPPRSNGSVVVVIIQVLHLKGEAVWMTNLQPSIAWSQKGGCNVWKIDGKIDKT